MNRKYLYAIAALIWGIPGIIITSNIFPAPSDFTASFYTGLGPMLLLSSGSFLLNSRRIVSL